jgi:hypothetical protein
LSGVMLTVKSAGLASLAFTAPTWDEVGGRDEQSAQEFLMYNFLLGTAIACFALVTPAFALDVKGPDANCLDGAWTVVCFEKDGKVQPDAPGMTVKADGGTITCSGKDGKPAMTMKVVFGPNGTVQLTEVSADTTAPATAAKAGVYVLTTHYLAISLNTEAGAAGADKATTEGANKSRCSIILKREGAK